MDSLEVVIAGLVAFQIISALLFDSLCVKFMSERDKGHEMQAQLDILTNALNKTQRAIDIQNGTIVKTVERYAEIAGLLKTLANTSNQAIVTLDKRLTRIEDRVPDRELLQ